MASRSPAERAGIEVGDIIMEVDGTRVHTSEQMMKIIRSHVSGETVKLKIYCILGLYSVQEGEPYPDGEYLTMYVVLAILDA